MSFRKRKSFNKKRIWLDITNSPHVLFFYPLVKEFEKREYEVIITARDYAQVLSLLNRFHMKYKLIGKHQGKSILKKAFGFAFRSLRLFVFGMGKKFDLALSHSSNDLSIAAFALRIPSVVMFDYEFAELSHRVNLRLATKILIPDLIPTEALNIYGNIKDKVDKYRGLKEQVYLGFMDIDENIKEEIGLDLDKIIITARPPATMSAYHRFENELFDKIIDKLKKNEKVQIVLLVRTDEQKKKYINLKKKNFIIPDKAIDCPSLLQYSDLVIGAGGTINREAVVLGITAYTVFKGKMGAIDKKLIEEGRLIEVESVEDIKLEKRSKIKVEIETNIIEVTEKILSTIK